MGDILEVLCSKESFWLRQERLGCLWVAQASADILDFPHTLVAGSTPNFYAQRLVSPTSRGLGAGVPTIKIH